MNYQCVGKVHCPIYLFRANERSIDLDAEQSFEDTRPVLGWEEYTQGEAKEITVPSAHVSMMTNPHVQIMAAAIQQVMPQPNHPFVNNRIQENISC